jgi:hypothetical protein
MRSPLSLSKLFPFAAFIRITTETIVDATIIQAPYLTKNRAGQRDTEMHPTKKGNQWYFGAKHISAWTARRRWCIRW